jgi:hypothetical protein
LTINKPTYQINVVDDFFIIKKPLSDGSVLWIPTDPANTDYQSYLEWLNEGNEPEVVE